MRRAALASLALLTAALAGCQTGEPRAYGTRNDPRFDLYCHDRPFESGICDQKTDFRLFAPETWR